VYNSYAEWRLLSVSEFQILRPILEATPNISKKEIDELRRTVNATNYEHGTDRKTPLPRKSRPYRLSAQGKVFAVISLKASEAYSLIELEQVFLSSENGEQSQVWGCILNFCFADAVKNGVSLALRFRSGIGSNSSVPPAVRQIARSLGIDLREDVPGLIAPDESEGLYFALQNVSAESGATIRVLAERSYFSLARVGSLVSSGNWSLLELDLFTRNCSFPDVLLSVSPAMSERHLFSHAVSAAATAKMASVFQRALGVDQELAVSDLLPKASPTTAGFGVQYEGVLNSPAALSWFTETMSNSKPTLIGRFVTFFRSRDLAGIRRCFISDLEAAESQALPTYLVYSLDFNELSHDEHVWALQTAEERKIGIGICPIANDQLFLEVFDQVERARSIRP